ncbi:hypothetical protein [Hymenobacter sp.]|uniref:hypothetical protein n=1 Tax=Hymenobacter sp. TaxID=1898978 RepID=UPI00286CF616|nr:hypothetical protein [Hymenobacter sp.]
MKKRMTTGLATEKAAQIRIKHLLDAAEADMLQLPQQLRKLSEISKQKAAQ